MTQSTRKMLFMGLALISLSAASIALVPAASASPYAATSNTSQTQSQQRAHLVRKPHQRVIIRRVVEPVERKPHVTAAAQNHKQAHRFNKLHCKDKVTSTTTPNLYRSSAKPVR